MFLYLCIKKYFCKKKSKKQTETESSDDIEEWFSLKHGLDCVEKINILKELRAKNWELGVGKSVYIYIVITMRRLISPFHILNFTVYSMFSYKRLLFILLSLVFALLMPGLSDMSAESIRYMLIGSFVFLILIYYLYRQWWFDEEKMTEKIAEKWEKKEHEALSLKKEDEGKTWESWEKWSITEEKF